MRTGLRWLIVLGAVTAIVMVGEITKSRYGLDGVRSAVVIGVIRGLAIVPGVLWLNGLLPRRRS